MTYIASFLSLGQFWSVHNYFYFRFICVLYFAFYFLFHCLLFSIFFFLLFTAPLRLDILLQDEKISRLNQQIHELTELNKKCDKHRKRQLRFLQTLINSFKGDNVPLSDSVCTQECKKHNVKSKLCHFLCVTAAADEIDNGSYKPCHQSWRKQFNKRMKKYDKKNHVRLNSNDDSKASEVESFFSNSVPLNKNAFFTLARLMEDFTENGQIRTPRSSYPLNKHGVALKTSRHNNNKNKNSYYHSLHKRSYDNTHNPWSYDFDYSNNFDEAINVILSSKEDEDDESIHFYDNKYYFNEVEMKPTLPQKPNYVIPDPLSPTEQALPTDGLNVTVPILGKLKLRDEEILRAKPVNEILCRQLTCVTNSGFKATVCFLAYDPDVYFGERQDLEGSSSSRFGKLMLCEIIHFFFCVNSHDH